MGSKACNYQQFFYPHKLTLEMFKSLILFYLIIQFVSQRITKKQLNHEDNSIVLRKKLGLRGAIYLRNGDGKLTSGRCEWKLRWES